MAEVPDHLAPATGVSDFHIRLGRVEHERNGSSTFFFDVRFQEDLLTQIPIFVANNNRGVAGAYEEGHRGLVNALRQMLLEVESTRRYYENEAGRRRPPGTL